MVILELCTLRLGRAAGWRGHRVSLGQPWLLGFVRGITPAHGRGGLVTFVLAKVTKTAVSRNASLPHVALPHKPRKTLRCNLFAPVRARGHRYMQKFAMRCPPHRLAGFSWFRPKLTC
jgi:hypothetical protein